MTSASSCLFHSVRSVAPTPRDVSSSCVGVITLRSAIFGSATETRPIGSDSSSSRFCPVSSARFFTAPTSRSMRIAGGAGGVLAAPRERRLRASAMPGLRSSSHQPAGRHYRFSPRLKLRCSKRSPRRISTVSFCGGACRPPASAAAVAPLPPLPRRRRSLLMRGAAAFAPAVLHGDRAAADQARRARAVGVDRQRVGPAAQRQHDPPFRLREHQPLRVLRRDQQRRDRRRRRVQAALVAVVDLLADRQHLDVLQEHLGGRLARPGTSAASSPARRRDRPRG